MTYTFRGRVPRTLNNGRPVAAGDRVADRDATANQRLIDAGLLVKDPAKPKPKGKTQPKQEPEAPETTSEEATA